MEERVAAVEDLHDGEMMTVQVGGKKVLLARIEGKFCATAARCPHWGGSLPDGTLHQAHVLCPLHLSTFDLRTGDLLEPPALDAVPSFPVRVEGRDVFVERPDDAGNARLMPMVRRDSAADPRTFAIIGGGAAAEAAAETLRQEGFGGRVVMISPEDHWPYDRPKLSKDYMAGTVAVKWLPLRPADFYADFGIERLLDRVTTLDCRSRTIIMDSGSSLTVDAVLIASGSLPRTLAVPGADLPGVFTLRSWSDADAIIAAASEAHAVAIVGTSFIGTEVAAGLAQRGLKVTMIGRSSVPFERTLGQSVGLLIRQYHEEHGTQFVGGHQVDRFAGQERVERVELDDGTVLQADLVVVGVGVAPATSFVQGVEHARDGSLRVDHQLRVAPGVWAAGDVALFENRHTAQPERVEHWRVAEQHGRTAARAMLGSAQGYEGVPFFWTQQFEREIYYAGAGQGWDQIIPTGDVGGWDFTVYYAKANRVLAACSTRGKEMGVFTELMKADALPSADDARRGAGLRLSGLHREEDQAA